MNVALLILSKYIPLKIDKTRTCIIYVNLVVIVINVIVEYWQGDRRSLDCLHTTRHNIIWATELHSTVHSASRLKTSHYQLTVCGGKLFVILRAGLEPCPGWDHQNNQERKDFSLEICHQSSVGLEIFNWTRPAGPAQARLSYLSISYHRLEMIGNIPAEQVDPDPYPPLYWG